VGLEHIPKRRRKRGRGEKDLWPNPRVEKSAVSRKYLLEKGEKKRSSQFFQKKGAEKEKKREKSREKTQRKTKKGIAEKLGKVESGEGGGTCTRPREEERNR